MKAKNCKFCKFFRNQISLVRNIEKDLLDIRSTFLIDSRIKNTLREMREYEEMSHDAEVRIKVDKLANGELDWGFKPQITNYCGVLEDQKVHYISEFKNGEGECNDFAFEREKGSQQHKQGNCLT